jgi:hypothetical protein
MKTSKSGKKQADARFAELARPWLGQENEHAANAPALCATQKSSLD